MRIYYLLDTHGKYTQLSTLLVNEARIINLKRRKKLK